MLSVPRFGFLKVSCMSLCSIDTTIYDALCAAMLFEGIRLLKVPLMSVEPLSTLRAFICHKQLVSQAWMRLRNTALALHSSI